MAPNPIDFETDNDQDQQQDQQQSAPTPSKADPVAVVASYLNPDKENAPAPNDWGSLFSRVANGPRIKPAAAAPSTPSTPDASKAAVSALGDFASATDTGRTPQQYTMDSSRLMVPSSGNTTPNISRLAPPPTSPQLSPEFEQTQEDLRAHSAVTPKYDPTTGKTLDKYKIGTGGRIVRALADFGSGGIPGVMRGAFGDRNAPGYYGRGAVNGQYGKDEQARRQQEAADQAKINSFEDQEKTQHQDFSDRNQAWKDTFDVAKDQDITDLKQQAADEKKQHDIETENLRQQLNDARNPDQKIRAEIKARGAIADDMKLPPGQARNSYILTGRLPDDEATAERLRMAEDRLGLAQQRLDLDREKAATAKAKGAVTFKDSAAIDKYSNDWYAKQRKAVLDEKAKVHALNPNGKDADFQSDFKRIEDDYKQRAAEFERQKQNWYTQVRGGKPVTIDDSGEGLPTQVSDIPKPEFSVRTGQPLVPPGTVAQTDTGAPATPVITGRDSKGRPTIGIKPSPGASQKTISKAQIQALADKHKMSYAAAEKQFTAKGYKVTGE